MLENLHVAFVVGEPTAAENVVGAMRDAWIGRLEGDYRRHLLSCHCADWVARRSLAEQWASRQSPESIGARQVWEFADNIEEILESVGAAQRLMAHLRGALPGRR